MAHNDMAQQVKVGHQPTNLSSIPATHVIEGELQFPQVLWLAYTCLGLQLPSPPTHKINKMEK